MIDRHAFALVAAALLSSPASATIDVSSGDLFVLDELVGLVHVDSETDVETTIPTPGLNPLPYILTLDSDEYHLLMVSRGDLVRFDPVDETHVVLSSDGLLDSGASIGNVTVEDGEIYLSSTLPVSPGVFEGVVARVDRSTGAQLPLIVSGWFAFAGHFAADAWGDFFVDAPVGILLLEADTGAFQVVQSPPSGAVQNGIAVLADGNLVVGRTTVQIPNPTLVTIDPATGDDLSEVPVAHPVTKLVAFATGELYRSGCTGFDELCSEGSVVRMAPDPALLYSGIAPRSFDVVPEPGQDGGLIAGALALGLARALRRRRGGEGRA